MNYYSSFDSIGILIFLISFNNLKKCRDQSHGEPNLLPYCSNYHRPLWRRQITSKELDFTWLPRKDLLILCWRMMQAGSLLFKSGLKSHVLVEEEKKNTVFTLYCRF